MTRVLRGVGHVAIILALSVLSQLGGIAWALALMAPRGVRRAGLFLVLYGALWAGAQALAPAFGRVSLPCTGAPLRVASPLLCALNRTYVSPELADLATDAAEEVARTFPGTVTLALDGSFPFGDGIPLLPHLSHDDGDKLDFAFSYAGPEGYRPGALRSPIGYFAFEMLGDETCPESWPTLRWDLGWAQGLWRELTLDEGRTRALVTALLDDPRTGKLFLEPTLQQRLGLSDPKLRFQGCRAARHDDHVHLQLPAR